MRVETFKNAKREQALERRTIELKAWKIKTPDENLSKETIARKIAIAERDIANIKAKL